MNRLALLVTLAVHLLWIFGGRLYSTIYLIGATFFILAPFFTFLIAGGNEGLINYSQFYVLFLMAALGGFFSLPLLLRGVSGGMVAFNLLLMLAALYSAAPFTAMKLRIYALVTIVAGMVLVHTMRDVSQLRHNLRVLLVPCGVLMMIFGRNVISGYSSSDRLDAFGLNPNGIGIILAVCMSLTAYLTVWDPLPLVKVCAGAISVGLLVPLLATGSRTSFGAAMIAVLIIFAPLLKRPGALLLAILLLGGAVWWLLTDIHIESAGRMTDVKDLSGRELLWRQALEDQGRLGDELGLLIGTGALLDARGAAVGLRNAHSMYVQLFAEIGILGSLVFLVLLVQIARRSLSAIRYQRIPEKWLAAAVLMLPLVIGLAESSPLRGMTILTLWWGFGLALLDRIQFLEVSDIAGSAKPAGFNIETDSANQLY